MKTNKLYIETTSVKDNLTIATNLALHIKVPYFTLWLYPELTKTQKDNFLAVFKKYKHNIRTIEPVTFYDGEDKIGRSKRLFVFDSESKDLLLKSSDTLNTLCDSLVFYEEQMPQRIISSIFHENMIIAKDGKLTQESLINSKVKFSKVPPVWW